MVVIPRFAHPRFDYLYHNGCCIELGSAGYLTTQSRLDTIFPTSSDQKAVMTESAVGVVVGQEKEYANSSCQRMGKSAVDCLEIVADVSKIRSWWN